MQHLRHLRIRLIAPGSLRNSLNSPTLTIFLAFFSRIKNFAGANRLFHPSICWADEWVLIRFVKASLLIFLFLYWFYCCSYKRGFCIFLVYPTTLHRAHTSSIFCSIINCEHFQSGDHLRARIICGPFQTLYYHNTQCFL